MRLRHRQQDAHTDGRIQPKDLTKGVGANRTKQTDQHDKTLEESFPASDPPAATGITGPRVDPVQPQQDTEDSQQTDGNKD